MGLLVDLMNLNVARTNAALDFICKSSHDNDDGIWLPVDSPFISRLVELFTSRGLMRLNTFKDELLAWSSGARYVVGERIARPAGTMERWTQPELSLVKMYLEFLPPAEWSLDDHMMAVDYLTQRYLPADELIKESDWLVSRAGIMGRVQASMEGLTEKQADVLLQSAALPVTTAGAMTTWPATGVQRTVMDFARVRAAENVRELSNSARHRMRNVIAQHVESVTLGEPGVVGLQTKLLDEFGTINRDWRRIAVTEAGNAQTVGFVAAMPVGSRIKRVERYDNACAFCRRIDGKVMTVVDPSQVDKDPDTMVWVGKDNIGRSASPRKRVGSELILRESHELWQVPAGLVHPHCRGRWVPTVTDRPGDNKEFGDFIRNILGDA